MESGVAYIYLEVDEDEVLDNLQKRSLSEDEKDEREE